MSFRPPAVEPQLIPGPAGVLEALLEIPAAPVLGGCAVVCHPHPQHGGTMHNKVVHMLARALQEQGLASLRFNYRGVGSSAGSYDEGVGESADAQAAIVWMRARYPQLPLTLAGFSFGGVIALRICAAAAPARLITVAPAVSRLSAMVVLRPACPWLLVQGLADDVVDADEVRRWAAGFEPPPELALLPGVGHFFHGALHQLKDAVLAQRLA
jgi:hypothetical protein